MLGWIKQLNERGAKPTYEKYDMFIEDINKGCIKKSSKSSSWGLKGK